MSLRFDFFGFVVHFHRALVEHHECQYDDQTHHADGPDDLAGGHHVLDDLAPPASPILANRPATQNSTACTTGRPRARPSRALVAERRVIVPLVAEATSP